jgi:hypothetical protein
MQYLTESLNYISTGLNFLHAAGNVDVPDVDNYIRGVQEVAFFSDFDALKPLAVGIHSFYKLQNQAGLQRSLLLNRLNSKIDFKERPLQFNTSGTLYLVLVFKDRVEFWSAISRVQNKKFGIHTSHKIKDQYNSIKIVRILTSTFMPDKLTYSMEEVRSNLKKELEILHTEISKIRGDLSLVEKSLQSLQSDSDDEYHLFNSAGLVGCEFFSRAARQVLKSILELDYQHRFTEHDAIGSSPMEFAVDVTPAPLKVFIKDRKPIFWQMTLLGARLN